MANFSKKAIRLWSKRSIAKGSLVFSDALQGFQAIARPGVQHKSVNISDDSQAKDRLFSAINTVMGNLKRYMLSIHHAIRQRSLKRYLADFSWRFNHQFDLKNPIILRLRSWYRPHLAPLFLFKMSFLGNQEIFSLVG